MRNRDDTPETNRAFIVLTTILCVFMLFLNSHVEAEEWAVTPQVKYIDSGSPYESAIVEDAIEQVVWSWNNSIEGLNLNYAGLTLPPVQNAIITFQWLNAVDHFNISGNIFAMGVEQTWIYTNSGKVAKSVISMNVDYLSDGIDACAMVVFSHELGHSLGVTGHSTNPDDLMYYAPAHCRPVPTDSDVRLSGHIPSTCYAELTQDYDIFIPEIYGKQAYLKYDGNFTWSLSYLADKLPRSCSGSEFNSDSGLLGLQIKGRSEAYSAQFQLVEGDKFKLIYAE